MKTSFCTIAAALVVAVVLPVARAAQFNIADGDVTGLSTAIHLANVNGQDDTITLAPKGDYAVQVPYSTGTLGNTGLPLILEDGGHALTIVGNGAVIRRLVRLGGAQFRLFAIARGADVAMFKVTISNGHALDGGAIHVSGELNFVESRLQYNRADRDGGALFVAQGGVLRLHYDNIHDNSASDRGGGVFNQGTCALRFTTVNHNEAGLAGGGLHNFSAIVASPLPGSPVARLTMVNSTVSGNKAPSGAGVQNKNVTLTTYFAASSCTITANIGTNPQEWVGIANDPQSPGGIEVRVSNTVIGGNLGSKFETLPVGGVGNYIGSGPLLGPLADNGGPTLTHMPLPGSPLINQGVNAAAIDPGDDGVPGGGDDSLLITDQRASGHSRILGGVVDIGAVERPVRRTLP